MPALTSDKVSGLTAKVGNSHEKFIGTEFENDNFIVELDLSTEPTDYAAFGAAQEVKTKLGTDSVPMSVYHKHVLLGRIVSWEGFTDENGVDLPCTMENKALFYKIPEFAPLFKALGEIVDEFIEPQKALEEFAEEEGNESEDSSNGVIV